MMNLRDFYYELSKAFPYIEKKWGMQNNYLDFKTNFIYNVYSFDELISICKDRCLDTTYVIHRWYNYHTSIACENFFIQYGCEHEKDLKNKLIDIYYKGIPYDVKLTVYPKAFESGINLDTREGKDKLIRWLYKHQSQQGRKHLANRLFIVCESISGDYNESLKLKANFQLLNEKIRNFVMYYSNRDLHTIEIEDFGNVYEVYSDIILIKG